MTRYWGYTSFRPMQKEIINSVLQRKDTLALLPTGGGKSVCYQLPSLAISGFCLVISPLIALMQDQVQRLQALGISAAYLYAGMHNEELERTLNKALHGAFHLLYISPERLQNERFRDYLPSFELNLIAIDEAHCISQWGHDFRPDYLKIAPALRKVFPEIPVLAVTATATAEVQQDIIRQLHMRNPAVFKQSFKRNNIFYEIKKTDNKTGDTLKEIRNGSSSIIYCRSRRQTEILTQQLNSHGISAVCYHAGMSKPARETARKQWMENSVNTIVATTAFGMGIDKADVRKIIHYEVPEHPEAYYQEAGRAGRDSRKSHALLLYNDTDLLRLKESTSVHFPPETMLRKVYQHVCEYLQLPIGVAPYKYYDFNLTDFCAKFSLPVLQTAHALRLLQQEDLWTISDSLFRAATIFITTDRKEIDRLSETDSGLALITTSLLRLYGTLFYYPTPVQLTAIAKQAKVSHDIVHRCLMQLSNMAILEYTVPKEGSQLFFRHTRTDSRHLLLDTRRIANLRKKHEIRTNAMLDFLLHEQYCRERMLLHYFNEHENNTDCGHCDICERKYGLRSPERELRQQLMELLRNPVHPDHIKKHIHTNDWTKAVQLLRLLIDEGKVLKDVKGYFSLRQPPTAKGPEPS